jgi:RNA methyltransferase, TrmH family
MTLSLRQAKLIRSLHHRRGREESGLFLAEGVRAVEDLLASPIAVRSVVHPSSAGDDPRLDALLRVARSRGVPLVDVGERELAELAATDSPQGILAVAQTPVVGLADLSLAEGPVALLVLDAVQDPGNLGTLVRTAEALGAAAVLALPGTVDPWNPKSVRSAVGSSFRVPILHVDWAALEPWLRERRIAVVAADGAGAPLRPGAWPRAALVVGNEGAGVSAETRARADHVAAVPLRGRAESLNVAAAAAILLHQLLS